MKKNKYTYLIVLQGNYGCGWEDLSAEDKNGPLSKDETGALRVTPRMRIKNNLRDYQQNAPGYSYRIIHRREDAR